MKKKAAPWHRCGGFKHRCTSNCPPDQTYCDWCLLAKFGPDKLDQRYDSEDEWGMTPLFEADKVIEALRKYKTK